MTGATEATLAELLREAQRNNVNSEKIISLLSSSSGGGGGGGGASPLAGIVRAGPIAGLALGAISAAANVVAGTFRIIGNILGKVVTGFTDTVKNLYQFAISTAMGTAKLSDFYAAFKDLPFFIGTVAGLFSQIIRYSEDLLEVYRNLTRFGASFGGSLVYMRDSAARAQLSMQEFAAVIGRNSEIFSTLGGNVQSGIERFIAIQGRLMGPNSPYSRQLLGLGLTAEQTADAIASFMRGQGTMNKEELANVDKVSAGVVGYVKELDILSKLTGKQREKIEEELKAVELEESYQQFLSGLDPEKAKSIQAAVANVLATSGKDAAEQLKLAFRGINTPITKGQIEFTTAVQGYNLSMNELIVNAINQGKSQAEVGELSRREAMNMYNVRRQMIRQIGEEGTAAMQALGVPAINAAPVLDAFGRKIGDLNKLTESERNAKLAQIEQEQKDAADLAEAQKSIRNLGNQLLMMFNSLVGPLFPLLSQFAKGVIDSVKALLDTDGFKNTIKDVSGWFSETFRQLKESKTPEEFFQTLIDRAKDAFNNIVKVVTPIWETSIKPVLISGWNSFIEFIKPAFMGLIEFIKPYFVQMFEYVKDQINDYFVEKTGFGELSKDKREREAIMASENYKKFEQMILKQGSWLDKYRYVEGDDKSRFEMYKKKVAEGKWQAGAPVSESKLGGERGRGSYGLPMAVEQEGVEVARPAPKRHSGTFGMTGFGTERGNQLVEVQPNEAVLTKEQMDQFGKSLAMGVEINNNLTSEMKTLNKQTADMLKFIKETADYTRRNLEAIKGLNGDLFA